MSPARPPTLAEAIGRSVMAVDAVIDGVISRQVGVDPALGAAPIPEMRSRPGMLLRNSVESRRGVSRRDR